MARRKKQDDVDTAAETSEAETSEAETSEAETSEAETSEAEKPKRVQEPLDPATLKPEAAEHLAIGDDAKEKMTQAAEALEVLGHGAAAKRMRKETERVFAAAEREARKIQKAGSKSAREAAKKEKKQARIAKLREQLEKLMAAEEAD